MLLCVCVRAFRWGHPMVDCVCCNRSDRRKKDEGTAETYTHTHTHIYASIPSTSSVWDCAGVPWRSSKSSRRAVKGTRTPPLPPWTVGRREYACAIDRCQCASCLLYDPRECWREEGGRGSSVRGVPTTRATGSVFNITSQSRTVHNRSREKDFHSVRSRSPVGCSARVLILHDPCRPLTKQSSSGSSPSSTVRTFVEGQEDLDAIAKQISDHAEAIYQTWKARGLAPTEILNCHTGDGAEHAFSQALNPANSPTVGHHPGGTPATGPGSPGASAALPGGASSPSASNATSGVAELLAKAPNLSNNSLEQLVSSFVSEDKARIAAQRQQQQQRVGVRTPTTGTSSAIKSVLQKFERNGAIGGGEEPVSSSGGVSDLGRPSYLRTSGASGSVSKATGHLGVSSGNNNNNNFSTLNKNNVPDVLKDTIVESKPSGGGGTAVREKPQTPVKPEHLLNHVPSWPLKNRVVKTGGGGVGSKAAPGGGVTHSTPGTATPFAKNAAELMDEVSREEERLINALKTGTVLNSSDSILPEVITSTLPDRDVPDYGSVVDHQHQRAGYSAQQPAATMVTAASAANGGGPIVAATNGGTPALNGNGTTNGTTNGTNGHSDTPSVKHWNGVPMKPNHIPILNIHQIREQEKLSMNFTRNVATTRLPKDFGRSAADDKDKNMQPKTIPSPIRPFLSRGSVAERVLIFEKCPEKAPPRERAKEPVKLQSKPVNRLIPPNIHTTLQRHLKNSTKAPYIPQFHFPNGKPPPTITTETTMQRLEQVFDKLPNYECTRDNFQVIVQMCQVPQYWRLPLFMCTQLTPNGAVDGDKFLHFWRQMTSFCHDAASRFVFIMSRGDRTRPYILPEDFAPLIQDVVDTHPGLAFLKEAAEFHSRYVHTVIARIFYNVNRSWTGKITTTELRKSNLLDVIQLLEEEEDINQIMAYFSYEHFYVIYCKFWELDRDHDLYIDQQDLARHNDHALSSRMIERIFSGCVTRSPRRGNNNPMIQGPNGPKMSYTDFVWFLLAEEDKSHPTAIEYWFRCMDVDGDGVLSMYELEYFYEEQQHRMESLGIETLPFEDCLCQMLDMIKPATPGCVTLADLKRCKMTPIFFDTFFNLEKYMEHEQRDPFAQRENDDLTDWDRYAAQEYELLVAEEGGDTQGHCYIFGQPVLSTMAGGTARMRLPVPSLLQPGVTGTGGIRRSTTTSAVSSTTVHCTSVSATTVHHSRSTAQRGGSCKATSTASSSTSGSGGGGGSSSSGTSHANNSDRKVHGAPEESTGAASQTSMHSSRKMMALDSDPNTFYSAFLVSYDEDEDYEPNIDILESQLDDCILNEW
uniref:uncharacterized protein LOC120950293 isoform X2 n=1 Tax=Anopheles coluzzii TaxID=1518534 RepID=UPI0020FFB75D|nr:uncharacterized protein LOC120950293 isoform X2 [Anopheles coluzzii]